MLPDGDGLDLIDRGHRLVADDVVLPRYRCGIVISSEDARSSLHDVGLSGEERFC